MREKAEYFFILYSAAKDGYPTWRRTVKEKKAFRTSRSEQVRAFRTRSSAYACNCYLS